MIGDGKVLERGVGLVFSTGWCCVGRANVEDGVATSCKVHAFIMDSFWSLSAVQ